MTASPSPPRGRRTPAAVAVAAVLVLLLGLLAVWRGPLPGPVATTPRSTPTRPGPRATTPATPATAPSPSPSPSLPGAPVDLSELAAQVSAVRGLPVLAPLHARVVDAATLGAKVAELAAADRDPETVEADRRLLVALRLVAPDVDLAAVLDALLQEQIVGLYVAEEAVLYIRSAAADLTPYERIVAAHEVVHALQDQSFDVQAVQDAAEGDSEAELARAALLEGDAVLAQEAWAERFLSADERRRAAGEVGGGPNEALAAAPRYLRRTLFFPYTQGAAFVADLVASGGWPAVDAALREPPDTTEQILHPDKYRRGEGARSYPPPGSPAGSPPGASGGGWERAAQYPVGEFDLVELFAPLGASGRQAAAGWGAGTVVSWHRGAETSVGMGVGFDTATDAAEACTAFRRWYAAAAGGTSAGEGLWRGDRDWLSLSCRPESVLVGIAADAATARAFTR